MLEQVEDLIVTVTLTKAREIRRQLSERGSCTITIVRVPFVPGGSTLIPVGGYLPPPDVVVHSEIPPPTRPTSPADADQDDGDGGG